MGGGSVSKLAYIAVPGAILGLLFLLVEHTVPAIQDYLFIQECNSLEWITDTCVESPLFWENV